MPQMKAVAESKRILDKGMMYGPQIVFGVMELHAGVSGVSVLSDRSKESMNMAYVSPGQSCACPGSPPAVLLLELFDQDRRLNLLCSVRCTLIEWPGNIVGCDLLSAQELDDLEICFGAENGSLIFLDSMIA